MLMTRLMPCLLVDNGRLVKTIRFRNPQYVGDPINAIKIFNAKEVDEIVILDISATPEGHGPQLNLLSEMASECFMPLTYGGGIRSIAMIKDIFQLGIEKVVINSYAHENPDFIREAAERFGSQSIVVALNVKKDILGRYSLSTNGIRKETGIHPLEFACRMESLGAGEIFLNSVDKDGTWSGYDIPLIKQITQSVHIPVIVCGGAAKMSDFNEAVIAGASGLAAGSMFVYQGKDLGVLINFPQSEDLERIHGNNL